MDAGSRVVQEQLPKILLPRELKFLDYARNDRKQSNAIYLCFPCVH